MAFANASGGKLVVGIENNGKITGFNQVKAGSLERLQQCAIADCVPAPDVTCSMLPVINADGIADQILIIDLVLIHRFFAAG